MGSDSTLNVVGGPPGLERTLVERLYELEGLWSRFDPNSEVSDLNRNAGAWTGVSAETHVLLERAIAAREWTGGLFAPLLLHELVGLGYDRDFRAVSAGEPPTSRSQGVSPVAQDAKRVMAQSVDLDAATRRARLPVGVAFDPGGIGKGLAADIVCVEARAAGADGVLVNLGGDLRAMGDDPEGTPGWLVAAHHPPDDREVLRTRVIDGGVATSSPDSRRWSTERGGMHHILDPTTGRPGVGLPTAVTVLAATGWQAEVLCTAALLTRDTDDAIALVREAGAHLVITTKAGFRRSTMGAAPL